MGGRIFTMIKQKWAQLGRPLFTKRNNLSFSWRISFFRKRKRNHEHKIIKKKKRKSNLLFHAKSCRGKSRTVDKSVDVSISRVSTHHGPPAQIIFKAKRIKKSKIFIILNKTHTIFEQLSPKEISKNQKFGQNLFLKGYGEIKKIKPQAGE